MRPASRAQQLSAITLLPAKRMTGDSDEDEAGPGGAKRRGFSSCAAAEYFVDSASESEDSASERDVDAPAGGAATPGGRQSSGSSASAGGSGARAGGAFDTDGADVSDNGHDDNEHGCEADNKGADLASESGSEVCQWDLNDAPTSDGSGSGGPDAAASRSVWATGAKRPRADSAASAVARRGSGIRGNRLGQQPAAPKVTIAAAGKEKASTASGKGAPP